MQQDNPFIILTTEPCSDNRIHFLEVIFIKKIQVEFGPFDLHGFQVQRMSGLDDQVDFQWLSPLPFFKLADQSGQFLDKITAGTVMKHFTIIIIKLDDAIILHDYHRTVKLIILLFLFVPAVPVYPADIVFVPFTELVKCLFTIHLVYKIQAGEYIKTVKEQNLCIQEPAIKHIIDVDDFLVV